MEYKVVKKSCNNFSSLKPREALVELSKCFSFFISNDAEWREIPGFPYYYVSSTGQIKHTKSYGSKTRLLVPTLRLNSYFYVTLLSKDGKRVGVPVAKLVVLAFVDRNIEKYKRIQHLDGIRYNNRLENLKCLTN